MQQKYNLEVEDDQGLSDESWVQTDSLRRSLNAYQDYNCEFMSTE